MSNEQTRREEFLQLIRGSLQRAEQAVVTYRRLDTGLLLGSIVLGALSTALAGSIAIAGEAATTPLDVPEVASGWQIICFPVAILAAAATISGSVHKSFRVTENLASAVACTSSMRFLELSVTLSDADVDKAVAEYQRLLREHATILA